MTLEDIKNGNLLIQNYMEHEDGYDEHGTWIKYDYHQNWNLLMKVIIKIKHNMDDRSKRFLEHRIIDVCETQIYLFEEIIKYLKLND